MKLLFNYLLLGILFMIFFQSCQKDNPDPKPDSSKNKNPKKDYRLYKVISEAIDHVDNHVNKGYEITSGSYQGNLNTSCFEFKINIDHKQNPAAGFNSNYNIMTVNLNDEGCNNSSGYFESGKLKVYWKKIENNIIKDSIVMDNIIIKGYQYNGYRNTNFNVKIDSITIDSTIIDSVLNRVDSTIYSHYQFTLRSKIDVENPEGLNYKWIENKNGVKLNYNASNSTLKINGNGSITNKTSGYATDFNTTDTLIRKNLCDSPFRFIVDGKVRIKNKIKGDETMINYGSGQCDSLINVTFSGGNTQTDTLGK